MSGRCKDCRFWQQDAIWKTHFCESPNIVDGESDETPQENGAIAVNDYQIANRGRLKPGPMFGCTLFEKETSR